MEVDVDPLDKSLDLDKDFAITKNDFLKMSRISQL